VTCILSVRHDVHMCSYLNTYVFVFEHMCSYLNTQVFVFKFRPSYRTENMHQGVGDEGSYPGVRYLFITFRFWTHLLVWFVPMKYRYRGLIKR